MWWRNFLSRFSRCYVVKHDDIPGSVHTHVIFGKVWELSYIVEDRVHILGVSPQEFLKTVEEHGASHSTMMSMVKCTYNTYS